VQSSGFVDTVVANSVGIGYPAIPSSRLAELPIWIPPLSEQRAIAAFLDRETARIDALIRKQERLIELLEEKRAALISHTVTKGLDPDVEMKDSGIEWLGKIPAHWDVIQARYIAESLQTGPFGSQLHSSEYIVNGTPVVNPSHIRGGCIEPDWEVTVDEETLERLKRHRLQVGDIIFARRGDLGRCALVTAREDGWLCGTGGVRMRPREELGYPQFLVQVFSTRGVAEWLALRSVGSTMDNLNTSILSRLPVSIPPLQEQRTIAAYLDRETAKIDALIDKAEAMIERLQEYRTALISAAVTGKIDVRDVI
jgi:type I restriction enzyme S subunit